MRYQIENTEKGNLREIEDGVKMYKGHVLVKYLVTLDLIHSKLLVYDWTMSLYIYMLIHYLR